MSEEIISLAFDFGASSGRAVISKFDGKKIELEEIHRFSNEPVRMGGHFYWDFLRLFHELKKGLKKALDKYKNISSIGIDTWGVDYGLLDENDNLLCNPIHYRDSRTKDILQDIKDIIPYEDIYNSTGTQYMELNTLYQLYSDLKYRPNLLKEAKTLLFIPDLFCFYLTGIKYNEYTEATTSQMINVKSKNWAEDMLNKLGLPSNILQDIIKPGNVWGVLSKELQEELECGAIPVVAVGSHDTASAVAGTPLDCNNSAFLSCGTWSLLGIEVDSPIINERAFEHDFTNEGGVEDKITFLKNINGLWLIQQLRKSWCERVEEISFTDIVNSAFDAQNKDFIIDPNGKDFMAPLNMIEVIENFCIRNGQGKPEGLGEISVAVYNGLTKEYKSVVNNIELITGQKINTINMVGGGIQDEYLCQLTADVTGRRVLAGPIEASVLGNIIMQLKALNYISSAKSGREIIRRSFKQKEYISQL